MPSLLDTLRDHSHVAVDSMNSDIAKNLGPFVDGTSNQAIAFFELSRLLAGEASLHHSAIIKEAIEDAKGRLKQLQGHTSFEVFTTEILMINVQLLLVADLTGYVHIQTNPKLSYSTSETVTNGQRIIAIFKALAPDFDSKRVCIKVPATWEGLQACRKLEAEGISTLATTMFCMEQATLAADANCTYIAPYVNELKVHFEPGYLDENKAFDFCREAQAYFTAKSLRTKVLAASLTSVEEVMQLAGIHQVTISAPLLEQLAAQDATSWDKRVEEFLEQGPDRKSWEDKDYEGLFNNESAWRLAFARSGFGTSEGKIIQAINYFSDFQEKLEELVRQNAK